MSENIINFSDFHDPLGLAKAAVYLVTVLDAGFYQTGEAVMGLETSACGIVASCDGCELTIRVHGQMETGFKVGERLIGPYTHSQIVSCRLEPDRHISVREIFS